MKLEIKFLNSIRLTKLLIAASRWLSKYSDVLNDLNVYPVPDGDTGSNMSMTLHSVENELIRLDHKIQMEELVDIVSETILLGAKGNSGTILSQFIQGFLSGIKDKEEVTIDDVAKSFVIAKEWAYAAVNTPVEGTMLTVIKRVAEEAINYKGPKDDFILFLVHVKNVAQEAVEETPNLLYKLKEAGVVDAGGKGIFYMLEGFEKSVTDPEMLKDLERIVKSQENRRERLDSPYGEIEENKLKYNYSIEFIVESERLNVEKFKEEIANYGDSVVCAKISRKIKVHIHTNNPGIILELGIKQGSVTGIKINNLSLYNKGITLNENIESTNVKIEKKAKKSFNNEGNNENLNVIYGMNLKEEDVKISDIVIVTDSASDLTKELIKDLDISIIPLKVKIGEEGYYTDNSNLIREKFWKEIIQNESMPITSQPSPGEFKKLYEELLRKGYKKILSLHISSKLSGTQQAAKVAKDMMGKDSDKIIIIDSKSVSLGLGYQVLYAARRIKENIKIENILQSLEEIQNKEKIYFVVNDIKYLVKGGRIGKAKGIIGNILNLKTIFKIQDGEVSFESKVIGETGAVKNLIKLIKHEENKGEIDLGIAWGGTEKEKNAILKLKSEIHGIKNINFTEKYEIGATIGSHAGPVYAVAVIPVIGK